MIGTGHTRYVIVAQSLGIIGRYAGHKLNLRDDGGARLSPYSSQYWLQCLPIIDSDRFPDVKPAGNPCHTKSEPKYKREYQVWKC